MTQYAINYDLRKPGQKYDQLIEAIQSFDSWAHPCESSWIVRTNRTAMQVLEYLLPHIDANDKLLVSQLTGQAAWFGLDEKVADWLQAVSAW